MTADVRVLVVDDDFMVARIHRGFVERMDGFEVVGEARSGADALAAVERLRPDLVLLDIYLPDISGLDVLRRLRAAGNEVDVLVITAAQDAETVQASMRGGVVHYLIKPFSFDVFRDRMEHFAHARRRLQATPEVAQQDVDAAFAGAEPVGTRSRRLPKGLTAETAALVEHAVRGVDGDIGASECARAVGLSRVSARRYLEHFVNTGLAEVTLRYGSAGRPERRYRWR
ncbi:MAG TPA: response regulator [Nocardioidaceae bacterium]|nr:response regulator [Nocardioidaceae bacterium]